MIVRRRPILLVRADASVEVGAGHIMRTLAIAQQWLLNGSGVVYLCHDLPARLERRLIEEGCSVERTPAGASPGGSKDARCVREMASEHCAAAIVLDGYRFSADFRADVASIGTTSLLVEDHPISGPLWVDFVLNPNPHARREQYPAMDPGRTLLGLRWTPLRREFTESIRSKCSRGGVRRPVRLLVTMGGSDPYDVTSRVLAALRRLSRPTETTVLAGPANPHLEKLAAVAAQSGGTIRIESATDDMPRWMQWADLAIAASGSTSWELTWMRVPWVAIATAENQKPILRELKRRELARSAGWHAELVERELAESVESLIRRLESTDIGVRRGALLDGLGARRVVSLLRGQG